MPPCLDIYVLSYKRDMRTIARFLATYGHPSANQDRQGEELTLLPLDATSEPTSLDQYESQPIQTLDEAISFGLNTPYRAFCLYLKPVPHGVYQVILAFRVDHSIVFGVSIDDEEESEEVFARAKALLLRMAMEYEGIAGFVACEVPPPLIGTDFPPENEERVVFTWRRGAV